MGDEIQWKENILRHTYNLIVHILNYFFEKGVAKKLMYLMGR